MRMALTRYQWTAAIEIVRATGAFLSINQRRHEVANGAAPKVS
jgi:hypothetical protein